MDTKEYNLGGIVNTVLDVAQFIPGIGSFAGIAKTGFNAVNGLIQANKQNQAQAAQTTQEVPMMTNPYGQLRAGGSIKLEAGGELRLKQFNAPSHEGGGQNIDSNLNPTDRVSRSMANIEKRENAVQQNDFAYIFSDDLTY